MLSKQLWVIKTGPKTGLTSLLAHALITTGPSLQGGAKERPFLCPPGSFTCKFSEQQCGKCQIIREWNSAINKMTTVYTHGRRKNWSRNLSADLSIENQRLEKLTSYEEVKEGWWVRREYGMDQVEPCSTGRGGEVCPQPKMTSAIEPKSYIMTQAHRNHRASFTFEDWRVKHPKLIFNMKSIQEKKIYTFCYSDLNDNPPAIMKK